MTWNTEEYIDINDLTWNADIESEPEPKEKSSAQKALIDSLNTGRVDIEKMMEDTGMTLEELKHELRGAIFQDPVVYDKTHNDKKGWLSSEQYLCGNLLDKIGTAKEMEKKHPGRFEDNIRYLQKKMPDRVPFDEVEFSLASPWIPPWVVSLFCIDLLELNKAPEIFCEEHTHTWKIKENEETHMSVHNNTTYGTKDMSALKIIENVLNSRLIKIYQKKYHTFAETESVLDKKATIAALEQQERIQQKFVDYVRGHKELKKRLSKIYNETYGCVVGPQYSGEFLKFPDLNPQVQLFDYQKRIVARFIFTRSVLAAHDMGSGKTMEIIASCYESWRMGLSEKNVIVVPKNMVTHFAEEFHHLYPDANVAVFTAKDFAPANRSTTMMKIKYDKYVAMIIPKPSFERMHFSQGYLLKRMDAQIREFRVHMAKATNRTERQILENKVNSLLRKKQRAMKKMEQEPDERYPFEQLGITSLFIDEAHLYKNITIHTNKQNLIGLHRKGAKFCDDMLEKVHFVRENGFGVLMATGTPTPNSITDLFTMQTYLQDKELKFYQVGQFDQWMSTFVEEKPMELGVDVDGQNFKEQTVNWFHNLPELMGIASQMMDFHQSEEKDLPEYGGYIDILVPRNEQQESYMKEVSERIELIRNKQVSRCEDNLLKVTVDGRKCALDIRLVDPAAEYKKQNTKAAYCAKQVYQVWEETTPQKGAQLIFCDISTPKDTFNIYDEMRELLEEKGIPAQEIAYVHDAVTDAQRNRLFAAVRNGEVRVLIGSTVKMGIGVNLMRLVAVHHLDIPWRPADLDQRNARMIRQCNMFKSVRIFRYITESTFDAYSWQLLERKQRFIAQLYSNVLDRRDESDLDNMVLSYAEAKALSIGNPMIKKHIEVGNELSRLRILQKKQEEGQEQLKQILQSAPIREARLQKQIDLSYEDEAYYETNKTEFTQDEKLAFGEELLDALKENVMQPKDRLFDWYQGFQILLPAKMIHTKPYVWLTREGGGKYQVKMGDKPAGCCIRLDNCLNGWGAYRQKCEEEMQLVQQRIETAEAELEKGLTYQTQIEALKEQLRIMEEALKAEQK